MNKSFSYNGGVRLESYCGRHKNFGFIFSDVFIIRNLKLGGGGGGGGRD